MITNLIDYMITNLMSTNFIDWLIAGGSWDGLQVKITGKWAEQVGGFFVFLNIIINVFFFRGGDRWFMKGEKRWNFFFIYYGENIILGKGGKEILLKTYINPCNNFRYITVYKNEGSTIVGQDAILSISQVPALTLDN